MAGEIFLFLVICMTIYIFTSNRFGEYLTDIIVEAIKRSRKE